MPLREHMEYRIVTRAALTGSSNEHSPKSTKREFDAGPRMRPECLPLNNANWTSTTR